MGLVAELETLPPLYGTDRVSDSATVVKTVVQGRTWYLTEYDPAKRLAYGYVELMPGCGEWNYLRIEGANAEND